MCKNPTTRPSAAAQELGLRDYAQFSGWILPEGSGEAAAAAAAQQGQQQQAQESGADGEGEGEGEAEGKPRGASFADLLAADAAEAERVAAERAERAQRAQQELAAEEAAVEGSYGYFNGIRIDQGTRLEWIQENIKPDPRVK